MDARLFFEVLLYINCYYFGLFFVAETGMALAKYASTLQTPHIGRDAGILAIIILAEFIKLITFRKIRDSRPALSNFLAVSLTIISLLGLLYILTIQQPVLKMEYIVCIIMFLLMLVITVYGFLQFLPCCQRTVYM